MANTETQTKIFTRINPKTTIEKITFLKELRYYFLEDSNFDEDRSFLGTQKYICCIILKGTLQHDKKASLLSIDFAHSIERYILINYKGERRTFLNNDDRLTFLNSTIDKLKKQLTKNEKTETEV